MYNRKNYELLEYFVIFVDNLNFYFTLCDKTSDFRLVLNFYLTFFFAEAVPMLQLLTLVANLKINESVKILHIWFVEKLETSFHESRLLPRRIK